MFKIGDKIVYPMHGAGIIEGIEEKRILDEIRRYYILKVPCGDMKIMIPVDQCEKIGVRHICDGDVVDRVFEELATPSTEMSSNWNRRNRENMDILKSGDVLEVAGVVRNLVRTEREKKLSTGEKKLLSTAKQILSSELALIMQIPSEEVIKKIEQTV